MNTEDVAINNVMKSSDIIHTSAICKSDPNIRKAESDQLDNFSEENDSNFLMIPKNPTLKMTLAKKRISSLKVPQNLVINTKMPSVEIFNATSKKHYEEKI